MQLLDPKPTLPEAESRIVLRNVPWEKYETLVSLFGDDYPSLKMNYLHGTLEIWMPGREHERIKGLIARLIECYALEKDIDLYSCGSTTFKRMASERGLEPDVSYCVGSDKEYPDLAIEVVVTSGLLDRLEIYRGLQTQEVWIWRKQQLIIQSLNPERTDYEIVDRSQFFPDLDIPLLASFIDPTQEPQRIRAFRDAIQ